MQNLYYLLHSGMLFGTERMAQATAHGLADACHSTLLSPPGPLADDCRQKGIAHHDFHSKGELLRRLCQLWRGQREITVLSTGVSLAMCALLAARLCGCRVRLFEVVHGGADEKLSYARKPWLSRLGIPLVAVSGFVRERLLSHGATPEDIHVIENFLSEIPPLPERPPRTLQRVAVVSRLDPIKRVDLLFAALQQQAALRDIRFDIYGQGSDFVRLQGLALAFPNVTLHGVVGDVAARLQQADLLLHLCDQEPFGLVVLEAMAAGLPALVPDQGGTAELVQDDSSGRHFAAGNAAALAQGLLHYQQLAPELRLAQGAAAHRRLQDCYNGRQAIAAWQQLLGV